MRFGSGLIVDCCWHHHYNCIPNAQCNYVDAKHLIRIESIIATLAQKCTLDYFVEFISPAWKINGKFSENFETRNSSKKCQHFCCNMSSINVWSQNVWHHIIKKILRNETKVIGQTRFLRNANVIVKFGCEGLPMAYASANWKSAENAIIKGVWSGKCIKYLQLPLPSCLEVFFNYCRQQK